jgi:hypothetical protein
VHPYEFTELNRLTSVRHFMGAGVTEFYRFEAPNLRNLVAAAIQASANERE